jgi:hypothetical protein
MEEPKSYSIEKLNESNYRSWPYVQRIIRDRLLPRSQRPSIVVIVDHKDSENITRAIVHNISYSLQLSGLLMVLPLIKLAEGEDPHDPHEISDQRRANIFRCWNRMIIHCLDR